MRNAKATKRPDLLDLAACFGWSIEYCSADGRSCFSMAAAMIGTEDGTALSTDGEQEAKALVNDNCEKG